MGVFVPGGQAGEESERLTRQSELEAAAARQARESERSKHPSLIKRILSKLRATK
jgi:hypothetical protein